MGWMELRAQELMACEQDGWQGWGAEPEGQITPAGKMNECNQDEHCSFPRALQEDGAGVRRGDERVKQTKRSLIVFQQTFGFSSPLCASPGSV